MLKFAGLLILALLMMSVLFEKANNLILRIKYLEKFERYVNTMTERIKIFKDPLMIAYKAAEDNVGFDFQKPDFKVESFRESDYKLISDYFNSIENRDLESIEKNTEYYLKKINTILESDARKAKENAKLLRIFGVLGAIFIFLLFL